MSIRFGPAGDYKDFYSSKSTAITEVFKCLSDNKLDLYEYRPDMKSNEIDTCFFEKPHLFREAARKYGVHISIHAPHTVKIASTDESNREKSKNQIIELLNIAKDVDARIIVIHSGDVELKYRTRPEAMAVAKTTLQETAQIVNEMDIGSIKIGLETMGKENQLGTIEEVIELCKIDPIFTPVIDFGHLYARSLGKDFVCANDYIKIYEIIEKELGADTLNNLHCHFSKIRHGNKGELSHLNFSDDGFGPDYEQFIKSFIGEGISLDIICESKTSQVSDAKALHDTFQYCLDEWMAMEDQLAYDALKACMNGETWQCEDCTRRHTCNKNRS